MHNKPKRFKNPNNNIGIKEKESSKKLIDLDLKSVSKKVPKTVVLK